MKKHLLFPLVIIATNNYGFHRDIFDVMQESMNQMEEHFKEMRQFFTESFNADETPRAERNEPQLSRDIDFKDTGLTVKIKHVANKPIEAHFNDYSLTLQHPDFSGSFAFNPKFNMLKMAIKVEKKDATESENQKSQMFFSSSQGESINIAHDIDLEKTAIDYNEDNQELSITFAYKQKRQLPINITRSHSDQE